MSLAYLWPAALVIFANVVYQICAKELPLSMDPLASMTITYAVATVFSFLLFYAISGGSVLAEYQKTNWAPFGLGLVIAGLEVGFLYAYKVGWQVNTLSLVQGVSVAVLLLFVGWALYHETLTWQKLMGAAFCLVGLFFINK